MKREESQIRGKPYKELAFKLNYFCETIPHDHYEIYKILPSGKSIRLRELLIRPHKCIEIIKSLKIGFPLSIRLKIVGASIRIKNNARLFYPEQQLNPKNGQLVYSAKVGLGSDFRAGNLDNEISGKIFIEKYAPTFPIPKLISYDKLNHLWYVENYISEIHSFSNEKKAEIFLSNHAIDFYKPFFFAMTLERFLSKHHIAMEQLLNMFQEAGESIEGCDPRSKLAAARTHGDLTPANMMIDDQRRLFVIDWEYFGEGSIALDLIQLLKIDPRSALSTLSAINTCGQGGSLPAVQQFKIALAVEVIQNRRNYKNMLNYHIGHGGKNQSTAQRLLSNAEHDALFFMSKLKEFSL